MKALLALALVSAVNAASLRDLVKNSLEANAEVDLEGVNNCENKCQNLLGYLSYYNAQQQQATGGGNNEYRACVLGCNRCNTQQANGEPPATCFDYCKMYNYAGQNPVIKKGVIEPDKACIIGCVIQLCQGLCTGSNPWTGANDGTSGCQIQTGYGVQTYTISNTGQNFAPCCTNLQNVCTYGGAKTPNNPNYNAVINQAHKNCNGNSIGGVAITASTSVADMCTAYKTAYSSTPPECGAPVGA